MTWATRVHLHILVPDGAYTFEHDKPRFHRAPAPSPTELHELLNTLIARITRTLVRGGVLIEEPEHPYLDLEFNSPLHQLSAAAVRYRIAVGPQAGRKTMTLRKPGAMVDDTTSSKPFTAARDGFSINAAVGCEAGERGKLERVCRYMARPPIAEERLSVDGVIVYPLKRPFTDGTTHVLFEPNDFIARLAALDCRDAGGRATQEQLPRCRARAPISSGTTACSLPTLAIATSS
jgi:hypothetical protein